VEYSDRETEEWWAKKSALDRAELFENLIGGMRDGSSRDFMESLQHQYRTKGSLSIKQLASLRKFAEYMR
jgi:hypothetical protein